MGIIIKFWYVLWSFECHKFAMSFSDG